MAKLLDKRLVRRPCREVTYPRHLGDSLLRLGVWSGDDQTKKKRNDDKEPIKVEHDAPPHKVTVYTIRICAIPSIEMSLPGLEARQQQARRALQPDLGGAQRIASLVFSMRRIGILMTLAPNDPGWMVCHCERAV